MLGVQVGDGGDKVRQRGEQLDRRQAQKGTDGGKKEDDRYDGHQFVRQLGLPADKPDGPAQENGDEQGDDKGGKKGHRVFENKDHDGRDDEEIGEIDNKCPSLFNVHGTTCLRLYGLPLLYHVFRGCSMFPERCSEKIQNLGMKQSRSAEGSALRPGFRVFWKIKKMFSPCGRYVLCSGINDIYFG